MARTTHAQQPLFPDSSMKDLFDSCSDLAAVRSLLLRTAYVEEENERITSPEEPVLTRVPRCLVRCLMHTKS